MCCVGGMVEDTTRDATYHEFEPQHTYIYPHYFFYGTVHLVLDVAASTNGSPFSTPILMEVHLVRRY
jgi:hypothetical protein